MSNPDLQEDVKNSSQRILQLSNAKKHFSVVSGVPTLASFRSGNPIRLHGPNLGLC